MGSGTSHWPSGQTLHACAPHQASSGRNGVPLLETAHTLSCSPDSRPFLVLELFLQRTRLHARSTGSRKGPLPHRHSALLQASCPRGSPARAPVKPTTPRAPSQTVHSGGPTTHHLWRSDLVGRCAPPTPAMRVNTSHEYLR